MLKHRLLPLFFSILLIGLLCACPTNTSPAAGTAEASSASTPTGFQENTNLSQSIRDYYRNAYGLSGSALKSKLQQIITDTHSPGTYAGVWTMYKTSDVIPNTVDSEHPYGKVWDMYSSTSADGSTAAYWYGMVTNQLGNYSKEGDGYNREHSWPKDTFDANNTISSPENTAPGSDGHHIFPTDGKVNGQRSNYPYGEVGTATWTSQNGSKLGSAKASLGYSGTVFEPIDCYKGDFARAHFYMATRYYNNSQFNDCAWAASGAKLKSWYDTMLRSWAKSDPVSQKEIDRNNAVYAYQGNRNPFIDYPDLIDMIDFTN